MNQGQNYITIARQLYPNWNEADELYDYRPILKWLDKQHSQQAIVFSEELDGFCFVAYQRGNELGVLEFAFGCCRDCDQLNGCASYAQVGFVIEQMQDSIEWLKHFELMPGLMRIRSRLIVPEQVHLFEQLCKKMFD